VFSEVSRHIKIYRLWNIFRMQSDKKPSSSKSSTQISLKPRVSVHFKPHLFATSLVDYVVSHKKYLDNLSQRFSQYRGKTLPIINSGGQSADGIQARVLGCLVCEFGSCCWCVLAAGLVWIRRTRPLDRSPACVRAVAIRSRGANVTGLENCSRRSLRLTSVQK
jgi:hypothetical protein